MVNNSSSKYDKGTSSNMGIYQPTARPFGHSIGDWSAKWWQWLLSIPKSINPTNDLTGTHASVGQPDPRVFFLCQTIEGVKEIPIREISIPKGTSIFMPILNWISDFYEHGNSEQELVETAKHRMDSIGNLNFSLEGKNIQGLEKFRALSDFFSVELPTDNILGLPPGRTRFISDGYWIFTEPIRNDLALSTYASCSSGVTKIGINYCIKVI